MIYLKDNGKVIIGIKVKKPNEFINFFSELFNRYYTDTANARLVKVDEDSRTIVEEW